LTPQNTIGVLGYNSSPYSRIKLKAALSETIITSKLIILAFSL